VLAVSATDANDKIAWFSSRGPAVGIAAPGVGVTQQTICQGGRNKCELFGTFNGTSMASPHVAGSAALVMGLGVTEPSSVREALASTARSDSAEGTRPPELYGAGIVDAGAAVRQTFFSRLALRGGLIVAVLLWIWRWIRRRRGKMVFGPGALMGSLIGGIGLIPVLPLFHALPRLGTWRWLGELAGRPFGEWDMGWSAGVHRWLPLANALPVIVGAMFFFGFRRLRPTLGGFAVGTTALLAQLAWSLDVVTPFGATLTRVWLAGNILVCLWLARMSLQAHKA
jgi:serine protease